MKRLIIISIFIYLGFWLYSTQFKFSPIITSQEGLLYEAVLPEWKVERLLAGLIAPTRVKITPEGEFLLVSQISGEVIVLRKNKDNWEKQPKPLVKIDTGTKGFPPEEAGLVGISFSVNFIENGKLFLIYSFKQENEYLNRIAYVTVKKNLWGNLTATKPKLIFEANIKGNVSHQITDALGIIYNDQPHLLVLIGEGFEAKRAQNPELEAGKLLLIKEDGSSPDGDRPFSKNPKVQALGIRNAYVMEPSPFNEKNQILIGDTGPSENDRIIFINPIQKKPLNFNWDGTNESLLRPIIDSLTNRPDAVIYRFPEAKTVTGLVFHPGKKGLPESTEKQQVIMVTTFGQTGSTEIGNGRGILWGVFETENYSKQMTLEPFVKRASSSEGKLGNPIGLTMDKNSTNLFFADIMEGSIYQVLSQ